LKKIVLDTDIGLDCDDPGALAVLHALADLGECEILASMVSTRGECGRWGVPCVNAIHTIYGRPDIPIGQTSTGPSAAIKWAGAFVKHIAEEFPNSVGADEPWDAAELYRKILSGLASGTRDGPGTAIDSPLR